MGSRETAALPMTSGVIKFIGSKDKIRDTSRISWPTTDLAVDCENDR